MQEDNVREAMETEKNNGAAEVPAAFPAGENAITSSPVTSLNLGCWFSFLFFLAGIPVSYYFQSGLVRLVCQFSITRYIRLISREFFNLPDSLSGPILPTFGVVVFVFFIFGEIVGKILERIIRYLHTCE